MRKAGRNFFFPAFAALYYEEFWPFYVRQHSKAATRVWHFIGTSFVMAVSSY
ncbi:Mpo1-like protein [Aneurinibacillus tyrosinisolvens]|uniref:Mpo1-like protein n=1 Tax=Aneurinibacillus tyrosinisolvens TaxID=1443435 RepID=UPI001F182488|nr:Mpo1-like protein [Aneurinibacillus tyrosinisolvens]